MKQMATATSALTLNIQKAPALSQVVGFNTAPVEPIREGYFKALTVKLDKDRYLRLKEAGLRQDKTSQRLLVEALDSYL